MKILFILLLSFSFHADAQTLAIQAKAPSEESQAKILKLAQRKGFNHVVYQQEGDYRLELYPEGWGDELLLGELYQDVELIQQVRVSSLALPGPLHVNSPGQNQEKAMLRIIRKLDRLN